MKKTLLLGFIFLLISSSLLLAQQNTTYSRVKIRLGAHTLQDVGALGLEADHGQVAPGRYIINDYSTEEIALLEANGFNYEILIADVQQWYINQSADLFELSFRSNGCEEIPTAEYETPENYEFGSMGGYYTYEEMLALLDKMRELYPHLISARQPIDDIVTHEGRPIYWLRVSDNPDADETTEPEVLYTAVHHAREPNSLSQLVFYLWYLLENYDSDEEIKFLVDNTEMYFIPCVNPDGYVYNETTNPDGGGLWRKNRWADEGGTIHGVDLNRNYGFEWGADDNGSSPDPGSQVFRGPAPFSEPETQAVKYFCESHEFQIAFNYHTYGNLLIHPWGYNDTPTAEDALFKGLGQVMTKYNNYTLGTGTETVGYVVNGGSDDWMYGETETKNPIYSMTPEVGPGGFGFWPPASAIDELNKTAMWQNLAAAYLLHNYIEITPTVEGWLTAQNGAIDLNIAKYGLAEGPVAVSVTAASTNVTVNSNEVMYDLNTLETDVHSFEYTLGAATSALEEVKFAIHIDYGVYVHTDTLSLFYLNSVPDEVVTDDLSNADQWTTGSGWDITNEVFVSAPYSMTDSPNGEYGNGVENILVANAPFSLEEEATAYLNFWTRWDIEEGWDYVQVLISVNGGAFIPLCGKYTRPGTGGFQPEGEPLYHGTQEEWVFEEIDISEYAGNDDLRIAFQLRSDNYSTRDGFYFDDLSISVLGEPIVDVESAVGQSLDMVPQPNPFNDYLTVGYTLPQNVENAYLQLITPAGQVVAREVIAAFDQAPHQRTGLNTQSLPQGMYLLQLVVDGQLSITKKVIK